MAAELAAGASARDLVPGDPDAVDRLTARLSVFATGMTDAAHKLGNVEAAGWSGPAAEAFGTLVGEQPEKYIKAGSSFGEAATALRAYTAVLRRAQADAGRAATQFEDASRESVSWRTRREGYEADVRTAQAQGDPAPSGPAPPASDPAAADLDASRRLLAGAREEVRAQGRLTAQTLIAAAEDAPEQPGLLDRVLGRTGDFFGGVWEGAKGIGETVVMIAKLTTIRMLIDPDGWAGDVTKLGKGLWWGVTHPVEFGKAIIDWETWKSNPLRAAGELVPDIAIAIATAGAGTAATAASRGARSARLLQGRGGRPDPEDWPPRQRYGPATGSGPLGKHPKWEEFKGSFRSGSYTAVTYDRPRRLYRVYGGKSSSPLSPYWTPDRPTGRPQVHQDHALPDWNAADRVVTIDVPPGVELYEGKVAEKFGKIGGGNQTVIPNVGPDWVVRDDPFP